MGRSLARSRAISASAVTWFSSAAESDPGSLGARLGAIREAAASNNGFGAAQALLDLARTLVETDPMTAAEVKEAAAGVALSKVRVILSSLKDAGIVSERRRGRFALQRQAAAPEIADAANGYLARAPADRVRGDRLPDRRYLLPRRRDDRRWLLHVQQRSVLVHRPRVVPGLAAARQALRERRPVQR
jgi:DNA-binding transcriptional ArsR family regulator